MPPEIVFLSTLAIVGSALLLFPLVRALAERVRPRGVEAGVREELQMLREDLLAELQQAVVRSHEHVLATRLRRDAELPEHVVDAFLQGGGGDDDVIEEGAGHSPCRLAQPRATWAATHSHRPLRRAQTSV